MPYRIAMLQPVPLRFGHHLLAVLGAAMSVSTAFALIWGAGLAVAMQDRPPGIAWLAMLTLACWLAIFIVVLPGAGLIFSLLWPLTRRGTMAARGICILATATLGIVLAPLASPRGHGATMTLSGIGVLTGIAVAAFYLLIAQRLGRDRPVTGTVPPLA